MCHAHFNLLLCCHTNTFYWYRWKWHDVFRSLCYVCFTLWNKRQRKYVNKDMNRMKNWFVWRLSYPYLEVLMRLIFIYGHSYQLGIWSFLHRTHSRFWLMDTLFTTWGSIKIGSDFKVIWVHLEELIVVHPYCLGKS